MYDTFVVGGGGGRFDQAYDHLLVATGATAIEPPTDGMDVDDKLTDR